MQSALAGGNSEGRVDTRFAGMLLICAALAMLLWTTPLLLPFRLFVTMVHEVSHALVGVATGGQVLGISISLDGSGLTLVRGGNLFLTASAGYVGSSLFGAGLLLLARERRWRRPLLQALSVGLVIATVVFFREPTVIVAALMLAGMLWLFAARGPDWLVALLVYLLAVLNGLYAVIDLLTLLQLSGPAAAAASDAATLQRLTGVPALFWALLWTAMAVAVQFLTLRHCLTSPAAPRLRGSADRRV